MEKVVAKSQNDQTEFIVRFGRGKYDVIQRSNAMIYWDKEFDAEQGAEEYAQALCDAYDYGFEAGVEHSEESFNEEREQQYEMISITVELYRRQV